MIVVVVGGGGWEKWGLGELLVRWGWLGWCLGLRYRGGEHRVGGGCLLDAGDRGWRRTRGLLLWLSWIIGDRDDGIK